MAMTPTCRGEETVILSELQIDDAALFASEHGVDLLELIYSAIGGEIQLKEIFERLTEQLREAVLSDVCSMGALLLPPVFLFLAVKLIVSECGEIRKTALFVCRVGCVSALTEIFMDMRKLMEGLMHLILECSDLLSPVMIAAVSLSGAEATAVIFSPIAGVCSVLIQYVFNQWGIAICVIAATVSVAGNLSSSVRLERMYKLCRKIVHAGTGGILASFMAVLSIQGRLGASRDTAMTRTARFAIENILPVIGGDISESLESLLSSANLVKNALGTSAFILIAVIILTPVARLMTAAFMLQITSAVSEPFGDDSLTMMFAQIGGCIEMMVIISAAAVALCGLMIGSCMGAVSNVIR